MPGVTLLCDFANTIDELADRALHRRSGEPSHDNEVSVLARGRHFALFSEAYSEYPTARIELGDYVLYLEGVIYQAPDSPWYRQFTEVAEDVFAGESRAIRCVERWVARLDGDFIVALHQRRSGDILLLNDIIGRLPLYVYRTEQSVIVARDLLHIVRATGRVGVNRLAAAEQLLYGYPLGERTFFECIERLPAASMVRLCNQAQRISVMTLRTSAIVRDRSISVKNVIDVAKGLECSFTKACGARLSRAENTVLSLSGGLDSRAIAAALAKRGDRYVSVTFSSMSGQRNELAIGSAVASALGIPWRGLPYSAPTGSDMLRLLRFKAGMNYLGMGFIVPLFDILKAEYSGKMMSITGDGGHVLKETARWAGVSNIRSREMLLRKIVEKNQILPIGAVTALTGVSEGDIVAALAARLASYPEEDLDDKYAHFRLFDREANFVMEGVDRNRCFFWGTSPFYAPDVFFGALSVPSELKDEFLLYRHFMNAVDARMVNLTSTTCGRSMRYERYSLTRLTRSVWRMAPRVMRKAWLSRAMPPVAMVLRCIREQCNESAAVREWLAADHAIGVLDRLNWLQSYMLFTLTSTIEYVTSGRSTLQRYQDTRF